MDDFLQKGIRARQLACELRNLLEELASDSEAEAIRLKSAAWDINSQQFAAMSTAVNMGVEDTLDAMFPIKRYPSENPLTWRPR